MTQSTKKAAQELDVNNGIMYYNGQYSEVITPLFVDLNDIFDDRLTLHLSHYVKVETKLAVKIGTSDKMHNVTGTIISIAEKEGKFEAEFLIDFIPDGLMKDLEDILAISQYSPEEGWE